MKVKYFWEDVLSDNVPICKKFIENYEQIKHEILNFVKDPNALHDYPKYAISGVQPLYEKYWKAVPLSKFEGEFISKYSTQEEKELIKYVTNKAKKSCPTIDNLIFHLESQNILANCFISSLIPGSIINPHHGWVQDYMRIHLGIVCDPDCKITIGGQTRTWEEGKILAFHDGDVHSVKHEGVRERIILSFDLKHSYLQQFVSY